MNHFFRDISHRLPKSCEKFFEKFIERFKENSPVAQQADMQVRKRELKNKFLFLTQLHERRFTVYRKVRKIHTNSRSKIERKKKFIIQSVSRDIFTPATPYLKSHLVAKRKFVLRYTEIELCKFSRSIPTERVQYTRDNEKIFAFRGSASILTPHNYRDRNSPQFLGKIVVFKLILFDAV